MTQPTGEPPEDRAVVAPRYRWQRLSTETRRILEARGEAGRFEYKRDAEAVKVRVLVAAANAAALEGQDSVTVLVGVDEHTDADTGAVSGIVVGLENLETAKQRITSRAAATLPVPVHVTIYEENLATTTPILRIEVRPTRPPHYDADGARVTRHAASHRAIADDELVALYLDREAAAFRARFGAVAADLGDLLQDVIGDVSHVAEAVSEVSGALDEVHELAWTAAGTADEINGYILGLDEAIGRIESGIDDLSRGPSPFEEAWFELREVRQRGVLYFGLRKHPAVKAAAVLDRVLQVVPDPNDYLRVVAEHQAWERVFRVPEDANATAWLAAAEAICTAQQTGFDDSAMLAQLRELLPHRALIRARAREVAEDVAAVTARR